MFYQYPLCKWLSKNKDGVFVLKLQGHIKYVGTTFDAAHQKKMKKVIKYLLTNSSSPLQKAYEMRTIVSVKWMYENDQTKAKELKEQLEKKYKLTDKNKWNPA
uniref:GIY-YIG domain-containing protein n=1 Tax=Firmicutes bacterium enrichment culture clone fosmid MGS-M2 TaxID=1549349 RepID=A0A0B5KBT2_9FIRM|nr:hypothetical protein [Firmicutes bacterium enrichment culture clone fosmid MGS-M2]